MKRAVAAVLAASSMLSSIAEARATDGTLQACLAASEKGQRDRASGKLREAREQFLVCGSEDCPALVRHDCTQWQSDLVAILPTVVFGAKDHAGNDLLDVTVTMDGEVLARKLDGKAIPIDPGPHAFKFEIAGAQPVTEKALVKEGEKTRVISASFADVGAASGDKTGGPPAGGDRGRAGEPQGHTVPPWIIVAVGAAGAITGVVVVLTSPAHPANCDKSSQECMATPGESAAQLAADESTAGRADSQPVLGWAVAAGGVALVAGGLLWHFLEPTDPGAGTSSLQLTPWATATGAGAGVAGRF